MYINVHHHSLREHLLGWFVGGNTLETREERAWEVWIVDIALHLKNLVELEKRRNELYEADLEFRGVEID